MPVTSVSHPSMGTAGRATGSRRAWVLTVVGVAALVAMAWWVTHSAVFQAREVSVSGNHRLPDRTVLRLAGVGMGTNVLWFSPGRAEARLRSSPWVLSARVSRSLPSAISVSVTERTPAAVLTGAHRYLVAADDTVLGPAHGSGSLPAIAAGTSATAAGSRPVTALAPLAALNALPAGLRGQVAEASMLPGRGLVLRLRSGVEAIYGDAREAAAKGAALASVLVWARRAGVELVSVDVRAPVTPSALPAGSDGAGLLRGPIPLPGGSTRAQPGLASPP